MTSRKKIKDQATCLECGKKMPPDEAEMMLHVATEHPLLLMRHPKVAPALHKLAYDAGAAFARLFGGSHG